MHRSVQYQVNLPTADARRPKPMAIPVGFVGLGAHRGGPKLVIGRTGVTISGECTPVADTGLKRRPQIPSSCELFTLGWRK